MVKIKFIRVTLFMIGPCEKLVNMFAKITVPSKSSTAKLTKNMKTDIADFSYSVIIAFKQKAR